jgi:hypothetical protein
MMDKESFEKRVFELAVSSLSAASGLIDEPPAYGALRVMAMIRDLVEILEEQGLSSLRLQQIKNSIEQASQGGMLSGRERKELLDRLVMRCLESLD